MTHAWLWGHIGLSMASYVAFLLGCASGISYLLLERELKVKHMGRLFRWLPPLSTLDRMNVVALGAGVALYTFGLLCGLVDRHVTVGQWRFGPTDSLAYITWGVYALLLMIRLLAMQRGHKVALMSVLGFGFALMSFVEIHALAQR